MEVTVGRKRITPPHLTSDVWKYFSVYSNNLKPNIAICNICEAEMCMGKSKSTSSMRSHLRSRHPDIIAGGPVSEDCEVRKRKIVAMDGVIRWVVHSFLPLEIVSSHGFKDMISVITKGASIPEVSALAVRMKELDSHISSIIKEKITPTVKYSVSVDTWKDLLGAQYDCYSLCFVDSSWEIKKLHLACELSSFTEAKVEARDAEKVMVMVKVVEEAEMVEEEVAVVPAARVRKEKVVSKITQLLEKFGAPVSNLSAIVSAGSEFFVNGDSTESPVGMPQLEKVPVHACFNATIETIIAAAFPPKELEGPLERALDVVMQMKSLPPQVPEYPAMPGEMETEWLNPYVADIIDDLSSLDASQGQGIRSWWCTWHLLDCLFSQKLQIIGHARTPNGVSGMLCDVCVYLILFVLLFSSSLCSFF